MVKIFAAEVPDTDNLIQVQNKNTPSPLCF